MTAQFWLWLVLSGLGGGIVGWWTRGHGTSGRELTMKREFGHRLSAVEEDAKRSLERARLEAEAQWRRIATERDALYGRLMEIDPASASKLALPAATFDLMVTPADLRPNGEAASPVRGHSPLRGQSPISGQMATHSGQAEPAPSVPPSSARSRRPRKSTAGSTPTRKRRRQKDDLKLIKGIGPAFERRLNEMGYTSFDELAGWSAQDLERLGEHLGSRIRLEEWAAQAKQLHHKHHGARA